MSDAYTLAETDRRLAGLIQAGTVEEVDYGDPEADPPRFPRCRVRVGEWVSALFPWQSLSGGVVRHWNPPAVGEQVMLMAPSGEAAAGFVLPGFYTTQHAGANGSSADVVTWTMPDGCVIAYDHAAGALSCTGAATVTLHNSGAISVESGGTVTIKAPSVVLDAEVEITHNLTVPNGDVVASGVSLDNHIHIGVTSGSDVSGIPLGGGEGSGGGSGFSVGDGAFLAGLVE